MREGEREIRSGKNGKQCCVYAVYVKIETLTNSQSGSLMRSAGEVRLWGESMEHENIEVIACVYSL